MLPYSIDPLHLSTPTCLCQHLWVTNSCPCQSMNTHMTLWDLNYMPKAHLNGIKYQLCIFIIILSMRIWWVLKYCWLIPPTLFEWHCKESALLFIDVSCDQSKVWGVWLFAASPQGHGSQWKSYFSGQTSHLLHLRCNGSGLTCFAQSFLPFSHLSGCTILWFMGSDVANRGEKISHFSVYEFKDSPFSELMNMNVEQGHFGVRWSFSWTRVATFILSAADKASISAIIAKAASHQKHRNQPPYPPPPYTQTPQV